MVPILVIMTSPNLFLAYASSARKPFSPRELLDLLTVARARNASVGITGLLLHHGGNFLQGLEGSEVDVRATMARIGDDRRHHAISLIYEGTHDERLFGQWSMACEDASKLDPKDHPGLSDYLSQPDVPRDDHSDDHDVFEFFRAFRDYMR